jgi:hypothetical protein
MEENALWPLLAGLGPIADGSQLGPVARRHLDARTVVDHVFRPQSNVVRQATNLSMIDTLHHSLVAIGLVTLLELTVIARSH